MEDVGPGSKWEKGEGWMTMDVQLALEESYIKPAKDLRISENQQEDFKKGFTFEKGFTFFATLCTYIYE